MSDEESFVILGSSPLSSMENDGMEARKKNILTSLESDAPGSRFESLQNSQINDLKNAQGISAENRIETEQQMLEKSTAKKLKETSDQLQQMTLSNIESRKANATDDQDIAASKLWSRPPQTQVEADMVQLSLEDCALKSPLEKSEECVQRKSYKSDSQTPSITKTTPPISKDSNLAASFIMGEINSDVLKTSVYSQFPSISLEASAEDVVKLQNLVTEYSQLKTTIKKANNTMKLFYENSLHWKDKMKTMEEQYKQQLDDCKKEIEKLRMQNNELETNFKTQIEALEIARKKDREENVQEISEKSAVLENMRAQIIKLEEKQMASFEFVQQNDEHKEFNTKHSEQEVQIRDLQKQLSELLASNLDLKDLEKQYVDELNCLKVNLTAAEELIGKNGAEIAQLKTLNIEKDQQIQTLEVSFNALHLSLEEQKERVSLLESQNEVHRADFEMEKQSRETAVKEKQQILQDLRSLQKRNQQLIEEHQKMADGFQKRLSTVAASNDAQIAAASIAAKSYFDNPQRPIRVLPSSSTTTAPHSVALHMCPICNKAFKSLHILLSHVNDCVDKNEF